MKLHDAWRASAWVLRIPRVASTRTREAQEEAERALWEHLSGHEKARFG